MRVCINKGTLFQIGRGYHSKVIEHYNNPRNMGSFSKALKNVGTGIVGAPACGDVMKLQVKIGKNGVIEDTRFKTFGCASAIASSSLATEMLKGKTIGEALKLKNIEIVKKLSLPPIKYHCSVLAEEAIKSAVNDFKKRNTRNNENQSSKVSKKE